MSYYDDASLVVIPSGFKTSKVYAEKPTDGSGDLTFTRTGDTATRVNSAGLIEEVRTNVLLQSESFDNASWSKSLSSITANFDTAPNGTLTADRFVSAGGAYPQVFQSRTVVVGNPYTASIYVKSDGTTQIAQAVLIGGATLSFTPTTTWQRVSVTFTAASSTATFVITTNSPSAPTSSFVIWGAQLEAGDVATAYIPTTTAAVSVGPVANVPRLDYTGSTCPRLLLEPQRTNLLQFSEQFNNAYWSLSGATITSNTTVAPDGTQSSDTLTGVSGNFRVFRLVSGLTNIDYSFSVFVKQGTSNTVNLDFVNVADGPAFNFTTKTFTTVSGWTTRYEEHVNGWFRLFATRVSNTSSAGLGIKVSAAGQTVFIWGAQMEAGSYGTSYIPTLAASATRGADACSKTGISSLIGQTEGWIYGEVEGLTNSYGSKSVILSVNDGSSLNRVELSFNPTTGYITSRIYKAGSTIFVNDYFQNSLTTKFKFAIGYGGGRAVFYFNGIKIHEVTSLTFFTSGTLTKMSVDNYNGGEAGFGRVSAYLIGTSNLTNAELATLTTL